MVEYKLPKLRVAGSIPVARFGYYKKTYYNGEKNGSI